jgi:hypothetical protein
MRYRKWISGLLISLAMITVPLLIMCSWEVTTVERGRNYVAALEPIGKDPSVIKWLSSRAAQTVTTDLEKHIDLLSSPLERTVLSDPVVIKVIKNELAQAFTSVLRTSKFQRIVDEDLSRTHGRIEQLVVSNTPHVSKSSRLYLNLTPQLGRVLTILYDQPEISALHLNKYLMDVKELRIVLLNPHQISLVRTSFHLANAWRWIAASLMLVCGLAGVLVARRRWWSMRNLLIGVVGSNVVAIGVLRIGHPFASEGHSVPSVVVTDVFGIVTADLRWRLELSGAVCALSAIAVSVYFVSRERRRSTVEKTMQLES